MTSKCFDFVFAFIFIKQTMGVKVWGCGLRRCRWYCKSTWSRCRCTTSLALPQPMEHQSYWHCSGRHSLYSLCLSLARSLSRCMYSLTYDIDASIMLIFFLSFLYRLLIYVLVVSDIILNLFRF